MYLEMRTTAVPLCEILIFVTTVLFPCSTFGMVDSEETCLVVMVYNTADNWGVLIGDSVVIPEPNVKRHSITHKDKVSISCVVLSDFTVGPVGLTSSCFLCDSRTTLKAYAWILRCSSSSTGSYRTPKVRFRSLSATTETFSWSEPIG